MQLSELFEYLAYGELAPLYIGNMDDGVIRKKDYPRVINNINYAIIEVHKRLPLLYRDAVIQMYDHITTYHLDKKYSETYQASLDTPTVQYPYIKDSVYYPFEGNVIKIEQVFSEIGDQFPLNDDNNSYSLFTPSPTTIQVPYPISNNVINVTYRAYPTRIDTSITDLNNTEVDIPHILLEPILNFMAYRSFMALGVEKPEVGMYLTKFENSIKSVIDSGLHIFESPSNTKFGENGWV
jgi:hypothetical protein